MAIQMYLIHPKNNEDEGVREGLGEFVFRRGGFILMATSHGSLIVAMDEIHVESVRQQPAVDFIGPVRLVPNGKLAAELQQLFAENVAAQLADRGMSQPEVTQSNANRFPPGYRPLRWNSVIPEIYEVITPLPTDVDTGSGVVTVTGARVATTAAAPVKYTLLQAGLTPTFYQFTETLIE